MGFLADLSWLALEFDFSATLDTLKSVVSFDLILF